MKVSKKEIQKFQAREQKVREGHQVNLVQDRKTGEYYNPQEAFDTIMNKPEITAMLNRLKIR
jgi:hypothetical protein